jgi:hypothetical protein
VRPTFQYTENVSASSAQTTKLTMEINNRILEKRFKEFSDFVSKQDGKPFQ